MLLTLILSVASVLPSSCKKSGRVNPDTIIDNSEACKILSVKKIYDAQKHCAFSDLTKFKGAWYLVFRASDNHAYTKNGTVEVLKSTDGDTWAPEVSYETPEMDLRDPKFDVNNNQLLVFTQGVKFNPDKTVKFQRGVVMEAEKDPFTRSKPYTIDYDAPAYWPWRFSKLKNTSYAIGYSETPKVLQLVKTDNFKKLTKVCDLSYIERVPSEGTVRFRDNNCYILLRRSGPTLLGVSTVNDMCNFKWIELPIIGMGGPNFVFYDANTLILSGRDYPNNDYTYAGGRTSIFVYKIKENKTFRVATLPSGGDTGYPGLYLQGNRLWVSFHSAHEGTTKIYLAKAELNVSNLR
ncbi:hypothetical protein ECE50_023275 [Chitinophaga sp. Mgbs1]|uniref:Exo-alpha-sialidase n=1 Tax=Chitinophaga solisilvae TaxID=1233460 RepID=A0A9Q5D886_9BACT|nr:hypothetical protein [Chitinophaga solisilvae]